MSQVEVERFLGRLITDADFRARVASSLESTCYGEGIAISAEEFSILSNLDLQQFGLVAESLDDAIRRT